MLKKYIPTEVIPSMFDSPSDFSEDVVEAELLKEAKQASTRWGETTVEAGNWLIKDYEGFYIGMTDIDFKASFKAYKHK